MSMFSMCKFCQSDWCDGECVTDLVRDLLDALDRGDVMRCEDRLTRGLRRTLREKLKGGDYREMVRKDACRACSHPENGAWTYHKKGTPCPKSAV